MVIIGLLLALIALLPVRAFALAFYTDARTISAGQIVTWHLDLRSPQGKPRNCSISWSIPSGWSFVSSDADGVAHGGNRSFTSTGTSGNYSLTHWHNEGTSSIWVKLRAPDPLGANLNAPEITEINGSCGGAAGGGTVVAVTTPTGVPISSGGSNFFHPAAEPKLVLSKTVVGSTGSGVVTHVKNGTPLTYRITVENVGDGDDTNVCVTDQLPSNSVFSARSGQGSNGAACDGGGGSLYWWNIGTLGAHQKQELLLTVIADGNNSDVISNSAAVTSTKFTTAIIANAPDVVIDAQPNLVIEKTATQPHLDAGATANYTITYSNTGSAAAANVYVTDVLKDGLNFVNANPAPTSVSNSASETTLTWQIDSVPANSQDFTIDINAQVPPTAASGDEFNNEANIRIGPSGTPLDALPVVVDVRNPVPVFSLDKSFTPSGANANEEVTVNISCRNIGQASAQNTILYDYLPVGLTLIGSPPNATVTTISGAQLITWSVGDLAAGAACDQSFKARVDADINSGTLTNFTQVEASNAFITPVAATAQLRVSAAPVLTLTKTVNLSTAGDGDVLVYTLTYGNEGSVDAAGLTLDDHLGSHVDKSRLIQSGGVLNGDTLSWSGLSIDANSQSSILFSIPVDATFADNGDLVTNTAIIHSPSLSSGLASAQTVLDSKPELTIRKAANHSVVAAGGKLSYTIFYQNVGNAQATNVEVTDTLPDHTTLVPGSLPANATFDNSSRTVSWSIPAVDVDGVEHTLKLDLVVDESTPDGSSLINTAGITSDQTPIARKTKITTGVAASDLVITKSVVGKLTNVTPGSLVHYAIEVENTGSINAADVRVTDLIPDFTTIEQSNRAYTIADGKHAEWVIGTVSPASRETITVDLRLDDTIPNGTRINNGASVSWNLGTKVPLLPTGGLVKVSSSPQLTVSKHVDNNTPSPGQPVSYTITYENTGTDIATDVYLVDYFPKDYLDFTSATGGIMPDSSGKLTFAVGDLGTHQPKQLVVTGIVRAGIPDGMLVTNSVVAGLTNALSNSVTGSADLTVNSKPVLSFEKTLLTPNPTAGSTVRYKLKISNSGTAAESGVVVTDTLQNELVPVQQPASSPASFNGQTLTWNAALVDAGKSVELEYLATVASPLPDGFQISNAAQLTSPNFNLTARTPPARVSSNPLLTIRKTVDKSTIEPGPAAGVGACGPSDPASADGCLGGTRTFTISVENKGSDTATNVEVTDTLPDFLKFVPPVNNAPLVNGRQLSWPAFSVPAGTSRTLNVTVRAHGASELKDGVKLVNTASVRSARTPTISSAETITADGKPRLSLTKISSAKGHIGVNQPIVWTLSFQNQGTAAATNVCLIDTLPAVSGASAQLVESSVGFSGNGSRAAASNVITWNLGTLNPGESGSVTVSAIVRDPAPDGVPDGTALLNEASIALYNDDTCGTYATPPVSSAVKDLITSKPVLSIRKIPSATLVQAGDLVSFEIAYENTGTDTATNVTIGDTLDPMLLFDSATGNFTRSGQFVEWQIPDVPAHAAGTVTLVARVQSPISNGITLFNVASIASLETGSVFAQPISVTAASHPDLLIDKTSDTLHAEAGHFITYTLTYENYGNDAATNVIVEDVLPDYLILRSATSSSASLTADVSNALPAGGGVIFWNIGTLLPGQSGSVMVEGEVVSPIANGTEIVNTALITSNETAALDTALVEVNSAPVLTIDKYTDANAVSDDQLLTYHIEFGNIGTDVATNITLLDQLPAYTTFVSADHNGQETSPGSGIVHWAGADLTGNGTLGANTSVTVSVTVEVEVPASGLPDGTRIHNQAEVTADGGLTAIATNDVVIGTRPVLELLEKVIKPEKYAAPEQQVLYQLTYRNTGNDTAYNVVLTDRYPTGAIPVAASNFGSFNPVESKIEWHLGSLAPGQEFVVEYTLQVPGGTLNGTSWNTHSSLTANNAQPVSTSTKLQIVAQPDMRFGKSGSNSVEAGQKATYLLDYQNVGSAVATGVVITDILPDDWVLDVGSSTPGASGTTGTITWDIGDVAPLDGGSITAVVVAAIGSSDGFTYKNHASITGSNFTGISSFSKTTIRSHVDLLVDIGGAPNPVKAGAEVLFRIDYQNIGNEDATGVLLTATIPADSTYVPASATNGGTESSGVITWNIGALNANASGFVTFLVKAASPIPDHTPLTSNTGISATNDQAGVRTDSDTVYIVSAPSLLASKDVSPHETYRGEIVTYTFTVKNIGTDTATDVAIMDAFPPALKLISADSGGMVDLPSNSVTWTIPTLLPESIGGQEVVVSAEAQVLLANGTIENTVAITGSQVPQVINPGTTLNSRRENAPVVPVPSGSPSQLLLLTLLMLAAAYRARKRLVRHT